MPNWCENILLVRGDKEEVQRFAEVAENGTIISFEALLPTPSEIQKNGTQYDWRIENWGTRSEAEECVDISECEDENGDYDLVSRWLGGVYFWTAWSPPVPLVKKVAEQFPTLTFYLQYYEPLAGYAGECRAKGTDILLDIDYYFDTEDFVAFVRENFDFSYGEEEENEDEDQ
jgi:hypothetical protein